MQLLQKLTRIILLTSLSVWLAACGGGGGSKSDSSNCSPISPDKITGIALAKDGSGDTYVAGKKLFRLKSSGFRDKEFTLPCCYSGGSVVATATDGSGDIFTSLKKEKPSGGHDVYFIRLNNDGSLDSNFSPRKISDSSEIFSIAPVRDGSGDVYIGGTFWSYDGIIVREIARVKGDGSLDTSFSSAFRGSGVVNSIALIGDGSGDIYAGGQMSIRDFVTWDIVSLGVVARLNRDGSVDTDFSTSTVFTGSNYEVNSIEIALDGSGDLYVGGDFVEYDGPASAGIVRLNSDGTLDSSFVTGTGFDDEYSFYYSAIVNDIALVNDGSGDLYAGGLFDTYNGEYSGGIVRLNEDGSRDLSGPMFLRRFYSPISDIYTTTTGVLNDIELAADGTGYIFIGGDFDLLGSRKYYHPILRLFSDLSVDDSFINGDRPIRCR